MLETLSDLESHHPMLENLSVDRRGGDRTNRVSFTIFATARRAVAALGRHSSKHEPGSVGGRRRAGHARAGRREAAARRGWDGDEGAIHPTDAELPLVELYLGVFERLFVAYQGGQVDAKTLDHM